MSPPTNKVNKTWAFLQIKWIRHEPSTNKVNKTWAPLQIK